MSPFGIDLSADQRLKQLPTRIVGMKNTLTFSDHLASTRELAAKRVMERAAFARDLMRVARRAADRRLLRDVRRSAEQLARSLGGEPAMPLSNREMLAFCGEDWARMVAA